MNFSISILKKAYIRKRLFLCAIFFTSILSVHAQSQPEQHEGDSNPNIEQGIDEQILQAEKADGTTNTNPNIIVYPVYTRRIGHKSYELKDHLGNVRVVVSDRKIYAPPIPSQQSDGTESESKSGEAFIAQIDTTDSLSAVAWAESLLVARHGASYTLINNGPAPGRGGGYTWVVKITLGMGSGSSADEAIAGNYMVEVLSVQDYYPFGMLMPGRMFISVGYRFGFQVQEKDDEVKGNGNSVNYKYRMHDPRLGRFLSVDPLAPKYPYNSPYAFSENRLLDKIELEGLETADPSIYAANEIYKFWNETSERFTSSAKGLFEFVVEDAWEKQTYKTAWEGFARLNPLNFSPSGLDAKKVVMENVKDDLVSVKDATPHDVWMNTVELAGDASLALATEGLVQIRFGSKFFGAAKGVTANPFKGKTFSQIDKMFKAKGFATKGPNPLTGKGSYFNPKSGTRYYLDKGGMYKKGFEGPHIDIWYKGHPSFEKVKYFLDGSSKMYTPL